MTIVSKYSIINKIKLTVFEGSPVATNNEEDHDVWNQEYMLPGVATTSPVQRWSQKHQWCRPSCIPILVICLLIFLVVLLPLLDHANEKGLQEINKHLKRPSCDCCRLSLVESIPDGLNYKNGSTKHISTYDTWLSLINNAEESIEIASLYWTLRESEVYPDPSSKQGEDIFQALLKAGTSRKISIKIAQNLPSEDSPNIDTELLAKRKAAKVRSLNFAKLLGGGVLHTKLWIVDNKHVYLGSANMDWRSLTQVKELGIAVTNCSCLAQDAKKIFESYWILGESDKIPQWPSSLNTSFNMRTPFNLTIFNDTFQTFFSSSPPPFNAPGRTNDIDSLVKVIEHAEKFIYIAVMDYIPLTIYTPKRHFWPVIDDALKKAALENGVKVKMLISHWNHSRTDEDNFLKSIQAINGAYRGVSVEVRRFVVPANASQQKIPFSRVNHNKYMVTDNTAFIGTSNWSGDYFTDTAGVSFVLHDPVFERESNHVTIRSQLQEVFERDWNSNYTHFL